MIMYYNSSDENWKAKSLYLKDFTRDDWLTDDDCRDSEFEHR